MNTESGIQNITTGIIIGVIVGAALLVGFSGGQQQEGVELGQRASANDLGKLAGLSFVDYDGNQVGLADFSGKPLIVNSWAVWCPFCRAELADFVELQEEFGDQVIVIAIDRQESLKKAKGYTDDLGVTSDLIFLLDSKDSFYKSIGGFTMPETIFVSVEGEIVVHKRGFMDLNEMREHTNKIISN